MLVTENTAKILGIDRKTGTLAVGKDANIIVSSGDLLDMRTNDVTHAFIQGGWLISTTSTSACITALAKSTV